MEEIQKRGDDTLSTDLNVITAEINAYQRVAGEAIFEIGRRLKEVRENQEKYGLSNFHDWEAWCKKEFNYTRRHANRFIRVFDRFYSGTPVSRNSLPAGLSVLDALVGFTDEELEKPREMPDGTSKKLTEMSRREIEEFKAREKKAIEEKEKAVAAAAEANRRAEKAEHEVDKLHEELESIEDKEPEYVEVPDKQTEEKIHRYEELFGDVSIYEGKATRVTNGDAITYTVFEFSEDVRKFIEKYGHLTHFVREFNDMIPDGKTEYLNSIKTMKDFLSKLERNLVEQEPVIIEQ